MSAFRYPCYWCGKRFYEWRRIGYQQGAPLLCERCAGSAVVRDCVVDVKLKAARYVLLNVAALGLLLLALECF